MNTASLLAGYIRMSVLFNLLILLALFVAPSLRANIAASDLHQSLLNQPAHEIDFSEKKLLPIESVQPLVKSTEKIDDVIKHSDFNIKNDSLLNKVKFLRSNQPNKAISLAQELLSSGDATSEKASRLMSHIAWAYMIKGEYNASVKYAKQSLMIAKKLSTRSAEGLAINTFGSIKFHQGELEQALEYYQQALQIRMMLGDISDIAESKNNVAAAHFMLGDLVNATRFYLQALEQFERLRNTKGVATALVNLGVINQARDDDLQALNYFERSLALFKDINNSRGIGLSYDNLAAVSSKLDKDELALNYHRQALATHTEIGNTYNINQTSINIGRHLIKMEQWLEASNILRSALQHSTAMGFKSKMGLCYMSLAQIALYQLDFDLGIEQAQNALSVFEQIGEKERTLATHQLLSELYVGNKQYQLALSHFKQFKQMHEDIFNPQTSSEIAQLKIKSDMASLQSKIALLEKDHALNDAIIARQNIEKQWLIKEQAHQRQIWLFALFGLVVIVVLFGLFIRFRQGVSRRVALEKLRVEIASDLHDELGASLTRISMVADLAQHLTDDKVVQAKFREVSAVSRDVVSAMGDVIWSIDSRYTTMADVVDRISQCANELLLPQSVDINIVRNAIPMSMRLALNVRRNIYLIAKEAINNCAKYAHATKFQIVFDYHHGVLDMLIEDNGRGFDDNATYELNKEPVNKRPRQTGNGLANMKLRSQQLGADIEINGKIGVIIKLCNIKMSSF
jgi:two-component system, NarL family, sensor histidine kinase UhpB